MLIIDWLKQRKCISSYKKNAVLGKNIEFGVTGRCTNLSNNPHNIIIGDSSLIMGSLYVSEEGKIEIGDHFYLGNRSFIGSAQSIRIGKCVIISNDVKIYDNNNHPISPAKRLEMSLGGFSNDNWS